jgi:hypothetical protein
MISAFIYGNCYKAILVTLLLLFITPPLFSADWTIFIYMAADNDLHSFAINDLVEIQRGLHIGSPDIRVIVYIDHIPSYKNGIVEYLYITPSMGDIPASRVLKSYPDEDSGSGETLLKFLSWAYPRYSSEKNMLMLWSHSNGWIRGVDPHKWVCVDHTSGNSIGISTGELHNALRRHNKKYDILILDACHTGSMEFLGEVKDFASYILASPDLFPAEGYPWTQILAGWDKNLSAFEVAKHFTTNFIQAYSFGGVYHNPFSSHEKRVSVSIFDTIMYDSVVSSIQEFSDAFADPSYHEYFARIRDRIPTYNFHNDDVDFMIFIENILQNNTFTAQQVYKVESLYSTLQSFILYTDVVNSPHFKVLSIWYPRLVDNFFRAFVLYWSNLRFSTSNWARFLNYVYGEDTIPPNPVDDVFWEINLDTIYIGWTPPIDPCPLRYQILFYDDTGVCVSKHNTSQNNLSIKLLHGGGIYDDISKMGYFTVTAIDESGNQASPIVVHFYATNIYKDKFYIAPNPIPIREQAFTVYVYLAKQSQEVEINIYSIAGQLLHTDRLESTDVGEHRFYVKRNLTAGIYFAVLRTDHGVIRYKFGVR